MRDTESTESAETTENAEGVEQAGSPLAPAQEAVREGGEPACLLDRVCPECGRLADSAPPTVCPRCGAPVGEY